MTNIVNLTPHIVVLVGECGRSVTIPPSGTVCRAEEVVEELGTIDVPGLGPTPVRRVSYGPPIGLPEPELGVLYLVSAIAAQAIARHLPHREDVVVPHDPVRDASGRVVGARALARV